MTPETRLSGFVAYATARPTARANAIRQAIGGDYKVEQDYYLRFRRAVEAEMRGQRDGSAIRNAVTNATEKKASRFTLLAANWPKVAQRWASTTAAEIERATLTVAGLTIAIAPSFAESDAAGQLEIVLMGYAGHGYSAPDIDMILRLVQRAYTQTLPGACVTYVDLGTPRVRTTDGRDLSRHDTRIDTDAAGLAYAMRTAA